MIWYKSWWFFISLHDKDKCKKEHDRRIFYKLQSLYFVKFTIFCFNFLMVWNSKIMFRHKYANCLWLHFKYLFISTVDICGFHIVEIFHATIRYKMKLNVHVIAINKQVSHLNPVIAVAFNFLSDFWDNCLSPRQSLLGQIFLHLWRTL